MKQFFTLSSMTFMTPFKKHGGGFKLVAVFLLVHAFIYWACQSDGILLHEIQLRSRFALLGSLTLLGFLLLWMSCYSLRGDIDTKRMHMLTSYPISRIKIFLGKWLGLSLFGALICILLFLQTLILNWVVIGQWSDQTESQAVINELNSMVRKISPEEANPQEIALDTYKQMLAANQLNPNHDRATEIDRLTGKTIERMQQIAPRGGRPWQFVLPQKVTKEQNFMLQFKFFASDKKPTKMRWTFARYLGGRDHVVEVEGIPGKVNEIKVPASIINDQNRFFVQLQSLSDSQLTFYRGKSLNVSYINGTLFNNSLRFLSLYIFHCSVVVAVGLTCAVAFSMSVSIFASIIVYLLAMFSDIFVKFIEKTQLHMLSDTEDFLFTVLIQFGLFFTTGLEPPAVVENFTSGVSIQTDNLNMQVTMRTGDLILSIFSIFSKGFVDSLMRAGAGLYIGYLFYLIIIVGVGSFMLKKKELDRIH
ncbi:MAG: ABC transporter permease [Lentisphaeria bacterium]|nr:ABC transporter permease [Lentisphaeria bacterium]